VAFLPVGPLPATEAIAESRLGVVWVEWAVVGFR
jgi:hypothetical protein